MEFERKIRGENKVAVITFDVVHSRRSSTAAAARGLSGSGMLCWRKEVARTHLLLLLFLPLSMLAMRSGLLDLFHLY